MVIYMKGKNADTKGVKKALPKRGVKLILKLFWFAFYISMVSFGGGFVSLSLTQNLFVEKLKWVSENEMLDVNAVAQASPGTIALNVSMITGYKVGGFFGAAATVIGSLLPPMAIITALYFFYDAIKEFQFINYLMKGMQAGVAAVILSLVVDTCGTIVKGRSPFAIIVLTSSFIVSTISLFVFGVSTVIYVVILSAIAGIAFSYFSYYHQKKKGKGK